MHGVDTSVFTLVASEELVSVFEIQVSRELGDWGLPCMIYEQYVSTLLRGLKLFV
eukprot:c39232_g1_i1 orf=4-168(-)